MTLRTLVPTLAAALALAAPAARAAEQAPKKTPALVEQGKASFATNCAACHGDKGEGDGVAAASLTPKPRNLAKDKLAHGAKVAQVYETLSKGIPGTPMVGFAHLPEQERWAIAYFVEDLRSAKKK